MNITTIVDRAKNSSFYLWLLNYGLGNMIPFNKPHGLRVVKIEDWSITTVLPYKRRNLNHINGLHACALATISEFTTGLLLIIKLDPQKYRLILKRLEVDYHYQGKMKAFGKFEISQQWMDQNVISPLSLSDSVVVPCAVSIRDEKGNQLTTATVHWQIKLWQNVKTRT